MYKKTKQLKVCNKADLFYAFRPLLAYTCWQKQKFMTFYLYLHNTTTIAVAEATTTTTVTAVQSNPSVNL